MNFHELKVEINNCSSMNFVAATRRLQAIIFNLSKASIVELITEIGTIPEDIGHDSTEEKLYTKVSDILLAKSLIELNLEAEVLTQRADCADVIAQSHYHPYSLVGDAKAFRLSRTAKNAKDYKVNSMDKWRGDREYSVLVCPYFQYPKNTSQIYKEALEENVALFSWEYIYILLKQGVKESPTVNFSTLWNQSEIISKNITIENSKANFLDTQNKHIADFLHISLDTFYQYFQQVKNILEKRGMTEILYYENEIERVKLLNREEAIEELLKSMKLDSKIATIKGFMAQLKN